MANNHIRILREKGLTHLLPILMIIGYFFVWGTK